MATTSCDFFTETAVKGSARVCDVLAMDTCAPGSIEAETAAAIRRRRLQLGLTLETLGERMDTTAQSIQRYETGARKITVELLARFAAALDCAPAALMPKSDGLTDAERDLISFLRGSEQNRAVVQSVVKGLRESQKAVFEGEPQS